MGVYERSDSPVWWLWLETTGRRERTEIRVGITTQQRRDSRALADARYHQRMNQLAASAHGLPIEREPITFKAYAAWYDQTIIAHHRGAVREREMLAVLRKTFDAYDLVDVTAKRVLDWRAGRAATASPATSNRELDVLKAMLVTAAPAYLEASPIAGIKRLREKTYGTFVLTPTQERRLLRALKLTDRAMVICALDTLMRLSDVVNLRREQDRRRYLIVEDPKVKPYKVPVSKRFRAILDRLPKGTPYYFAHRRLAKKPRDYRGSVQDMLEAACQKANIPYGRAKRGLTFHALRHTGTTRLVERGVSLRIIQELGGWQSLRQLERYSHPSERAKRAAVEMIGSQVTLRSTKTEKKAVATHARLTESAAPQKTGRKSRQTA